jgi:uncharacterized membrane protein
MSRFALLWGAVVLGALSGAAPARADFRVCNQTSYILEAAAGYEAGTQMLTRGWTRVLPGDCSVALEGSLAAPEYFLYARTSRAHSGPSHNWGGQIRLCAKESNFAIDVPVGATRCGSDDAFLMPFASVATGHKANWTATLTGTSHFANPAAARGAGIARLLGDVGYKVGPGSNARTAADALAQFRARMRLPANATDTDVLDALQTEALKTAAPTGYIVCNDSPTELWAAIALKSPRNGVSRGWWDVPSGACAKVLTQQLTFDTVYLHATRKGNPKLVSGNQNFCVADVAFEIYGNTRCTGRGLSEQGFAATTTKGVAGFAAHIGSNGLLPPAPKLPPASAHK